MALPRAQKQQVVKCVSGWGHCAPHLHCAAAWCICCAPCTSQGVSSGKSWYLRPAEVSAPPAARLRTMSQGCHASLLASPVVALLHGRPCLGHLLCRAMPQVPARRLRRWPRLRKRQASREVVLLPASSVALCRHRRMRFFAVLVNVRRALRVHLRLRVPTGFVQPVSPTSN